MWLRIRSLGGIDDSKGRRLNRPPKRMLFFSRAFSQANGGREQFQLSNKTEARAESTNAEREEAG